MTKKASYHNAKSLRASGLVILALSLATFPAAFSRAVKAQSPVKPIASAASESNGGPKEGIKVHGHWTIDVRQPNGTLVGHHEFENDLQPGVDGGARSLMRLLAGGVAGTWFIGIDAPNVTDLDRPCNLAGGGTPFECELVEPNENVDIRTPFRNLVHTFQPNNTLELTGSVSAARNARIGKVRTNLAICLVSDQMPCSFFNGTGGAFTLAVLSAPIAVLKDQIIQVKVVISFS